MTEDGVVQSIFHVNINCSDLDRTLDFYTKLGFREVLNMGEVEGRADASYEALGTYGEFKHRGPVVLFLGDDRFQTRLDVMQWMRPPTVAVDPVRPSETLGINRIALRVTGLRNLHARLVDEGLKFMSEPAGPFPDRMIEAIVCLRDPDGLMVEMMEFTPGAGRLYSRP